MKHLKIGPYGITALLLIALAISLRILLAAQSWPRTNSDEGTIGLMAMHIAYRGEHPIFYYGQNYMGALEAYLGAALFQLFGVSIFSLRLGLILLFALFLVSMYLLASLLYTKKVALITLALLSLGSSTLLIRELTAIGGYPETLLFGSLAFLMASWLALSSPLHRGEMWLRLIGFGAWGLVIGLGIWSDFLILPFVLMSGLLLLVFCWRELRKWAGLFLLVGLIIGAFPLIVYNLHAQPGQDSLSILWRLQHNVGSSMGNPNQLSLLHEIQGTIQVSLPTATANPFCPVTELPFLGPTSPNTLQCSIVRTSWGIGFIILFVITTFLTTKSLWMSWRKFRSQSHSEYFELNQQRQTLIRYFAQLMLLGSAALSLLSFALSPAPTVWPSIYSRYLIGLLIVVHALISPLLKGASSVKLRLTKLADESALGAQRSLRSAFQFLRPPRVTRKGSGGALFMNGERSDAPFVGADLSCPPPIYRPNSAAPHGSAGVTIPTFATAIRKHVSSSSKMVKAIVCSAILLFIGLTFLTGTILAFADIPSTQAIDQQEYSMIHNLLRLGITHIYSDYWTCNRIIFESQEKVICGVIDEHLQPTHNRYPQYYAIVSADPHSAYAFPIGSSQSVAFGQQATLSGKHYQRFVFDGYVIYK